MTRYLYRNNYSIRISIDLESIAPEGSHQVGQIRRRILRVCPSTLHCSRSNISFLDPWSVRCLSPLGISPRKCSLSLEARSGRSHMKPQNSGSASASACILMKSTCALLAPSAMKMVSRKHSSTSGTDSVSALTCTSSYKV